MFKIFIVYKRISWQAFELNESNGESKFSQQIRYFALYPSAIYEACS